MILESLKHALSELGVKQGDIICVSSDITRFGIPKEAKTAVAEYGIGALMDAYIETFRSAVGETGGILMPTFTYSATRGEVFDTQATPSTVGALTEHFRTYPGVIRSAHPVFSYAGWGKGAEKYLEISTYDCFGEESIFGKLHRDNRTYLMFGVTLQRGATAVYYSEQKARVRYRYFKNFKGIVRDEAGEKEVIVPYFVRDYVVGYEDSWDALAAAGFKSGVLRAATFSSGPLAAIAAQDLDSLIRTNLAADPDFLIHLNR